SAAGVEEARPQFTKPLGANETAAAWLLLTAGEALPGLRTIHRAARKDECAFRENTQH
ncbi:MAG: hypothetical protein GY811_13720, partial [Myxococcales bacterium]|nr:hypothetical protein [Myxococcales bacterium]